MDTKKIRRGARLARPPRLLNQRAQAQDLSGAQGKAGDTCYTLKERQEKE